MERRIINPWKWQDEFALDVDSFFEAYDAVASRLTEAGCRSAGSLIGVARLAFPELLVEFEATAVAS